MKRSHTPSCIAVFLIRSFGFSVLLLNGLSHSPCHAQRVFADSSRLRDPVYLEERIKSISDSELFGSLDLARPALRDVRHAARTGDYRKAYEGWGKYWTRKDQPRYVTQRYRLLIDSEMLMSYDRCRTDAARHPGETDTVLAQAGLILKHEIRTWGDRVVAFDSVVDFNRELGQSGKYGFHYWGWSQPLNVAFILTRNQAYLAAFDTLFNQWYEQRNRITRGFPDLDVVYYELGLGTRNRMFIEHYLLPFEKRSLQTHERILKTVLGAARWLYELQRCEGYRAGNWQIHGSYMLAQIAMVFPEFKESRRWLAMGLQRLREHVDRDFFEDGGHSERSPRNYTLATYLCYRNLGYLLDEYKTQRELARHVRRVMGRTVDWWLAMMTPNGEPPAINDSHRGEFPTPILRDGAELFAKPAVYGVLKSLFGVRTGSESPLPSFTSRHMPVSGFTVMRSDWSPRALYMNINYGKFSGFHTHSDMLDFELYAYGQALAVDAGIGLTYDDSLYIPWYQSSRAHNMVVVNDGNIDRQGTKGEGIEWSSTRSVEYFGGQHSGYASLGVQHRRQIAFIKPDYWFVLDNMRCQERDDTLSWYFHSPTRLTPFKHGFRSSTAPGIVVLPALLTWAAKMGEGWSASTIDKTPGKTQMINWIRFDQLTAHDSLSQYPVLLFPFKGDVPSVTCTQESTQHFLVTTERYTDDLYFPVGAYDDGEISTDARFLWVRRGPGMRRSFGIVLGTFLKYQGKQLWRSSVRASFQKEITP